MRFLCLLIKKMQLAVKTCVVQMCALRPVILAALYLRSSNHVPCKGLG